jgi:leucyl/phenylalanyl-tRNA---protein transferase
MPYLCTMPIFQLDEQLWFPPVEYAEEDGLLAVDGDLSAERLLLAYRSGIFPWYNEEDPILWWSPNPRMVLYPSELKVSKSMQQVLRSNRFKVTFDTAFSQVIVACANALRDGQPGTWIVPEMIDAYTTLHTMGYAHSVEVWRNELLVGGLYGLALGKVFCGESMFSLESNASKTGFITLVRWLQQQGFQFIDCQTHTPHLESLGARQVAREWFLNELELALKDGVKPSKWVFP